VAEAAPGPGRESARSFCQRILRGGSLVDKLAPPRRAVRGDGAEAAAPPPRTPARTPGIALVRGAERLPPPAALTDPAARARCLARFAHHEIQAVELFAWAWLRWPLLPEGMRHGLLHVLREEQLHARLYLARLRAHGSRLADHACSGYLWSQTRTISASPHGPRAFLAAVGLTFEQANLDFCGLYRDAFRAAGDEASARVCERVRRDEIGHVRLAARWLAMLDAGEAGGDGPGPEVVHGADAGGPGGPDGEVARYERAVPFPLSAARAKGRRFDAEARRRAGLGEAFIAHVREARSSQELAHRSRGARQGRRVP